MEQVTNTKTFDTSESENGYVTIDEYCEEFGDYAVIDKVETLKPDSLKVLDKKHDLWLTSLSPICKSKKTNAEEQNQTMDELMAEVASLCEEPSSVSEEPSYVNVTLTTECDDARPNNDVHVCNISCSSLACKKHHEHGEKENTSKVTVVSSPMKYSRKVPSLVSSPNKYSLKVPSSTVSSDPCKSPLSEISAASLSSMNNKKANSFDDFSESILTENRGYTSSGSDETFNIYAGDTSCLDEDMKKSKSLLWANIKEQTFEELLADVKSLCEHELDDDKPTMSKPCTNVLDDGLNAQPISKIDVNKIMASTPLPTKKLLPSSTVTSLQVNNGSEQNARKKISYPSLLGGNVAERSKILWGSPKSENNIAGIVTDTPGRFKGLNITRVVTEEEDNNEDIDEYAEDILGLDTIINTDIDDDDDEDIDDTILSASSDNLDETVIEVGRRVVVVSGNALDSTVCSDADVIEKQVNNLEHSVTNNNLDSETLCNRLNSTAKDASAFLEISMNVVDTEPFSDETIQPIITTVKLKSLDNTDTIKSKSSAESDTIEGKMKVPIGKSNHEHDIRKVQIAVQSDDTRKVKIFGKTDTIISKPRDQIAVVKPMSSDQTESVKSKTVGRAEPLSLTNITEPQTDLDDTSSSTGKSIDTTDIVKIKPKSVETESILKTKGISSSDHHLVTDIAKPESTKTSINEVKSDETVKSEIKVNDRLVEIQNELTENTSSDKSIIAQKSVTLPEDSFIIIDSVSHAEKLVDEFVVVDKHEVLASKSSGTAISKSGDISNSKALTSEKGLNASIVTEAGIVITSVDSDGMILKTLLTASAEVGGKDKENEEPALKEDDIILEDKRSVLDIDNNLINEVKKKWNTVGVQDPEVNLTTSSFFSRRQRKKGLFVKGQLEGPHKSCLLLGNHSSKKRKASGDCPFETDDRYGKKQKTDDGIVKRKRWASARESIVQSYAANAGNVRDDLAVQIQKLKHEFRLRIETILRQEDDEKIFLMNGHRQRLRALLMQQNLEVLSIRNQLHYGNGAWVQYQMMQLNLEHLHQKQNLERNHNYEFNDLDKQTRQQVAMERDKFVAKENQLLSLQHQIESRNATAQDGDFMVSVNVKKGPCRTNKQTISFIQVCLPAEIASHMMAADDIIDSFYLYTV